MKSKMIFGVLALVVALTTICMVAMAGTGNGAHRALVRFSREPTWKEAAASHPPASDR